MPSKVLLFANTEWYLYNFRRSLALALRERGVEVLLVSPPGPYGARLCELGFRWIPAPMHRQSLNPWRELALLAWLRKLMAEENVDLVHGFTIKCAVYGALAARLAGVQASVSSVAGMGYVFISRQLKARVLRPLVHVLFRVAFSGRRARLVVQNRDDFAFFRDRRLVAPGNIRLIQGSGVDCVRFAPADHPDAVRPFRVVLPARMLWDKGVAEYVAAARNLRATDSAIEFLLAGAPDPGNPASVPPEQLHAWQEEGLIKWLGHVDDMPSLFRSVHVVVLPSYREGLPKGLAEAGACGLALVTTDVPGCREVVSHEVDGLLVPVKDAPALALAIDRLRRDPALRARLGEAARTKALARFDEKSVVDRTLAVYRELDVAVPG